MTTTLLASIWHRQEMGGVGGGGQECLAICPDIFDILLLAEEGSGEMVTQLLSCLPGYPSLSPKALLSLLQPLLLSCLRPAINHCFCVPRSPARLLCDLFCSGNWKLGREKYNF